ncbi:MAG TPA: TetR/AcrR family transcriptional regulator [Candidatus Acidoferrales bacterium]|nr:TetR/AcrR family transcriptional regulator [Candidatus Acidoferrales bacterium]
MQVQRKTRLEELTERCLATFIGAGTMDLSLDQLATAVGISKRMLVHYFGDRENLEQAAMTLLEERLRAQFAPETFPDGVSSQTVVTALWERSTAPSAKGVLLLVMDLSRRAWSGSTRAKGFYLEQQRQWVRLLMKFLPDQTAVEEVLQLFQGALLAYLITGDPEPGKRSLARILPSNSTTQGPTSQKKTRARP